MSWLNDPFKIQAGDGFPSYSTKISRECLEQLHALVMACCPCAVEEKQLLPGLKAIIEEELLLAVQAERQAVLMRITSPSSH